MGVHRAAPATEKFIVANGDEGDPGSYIDKYLMEHSPDLLLEGMALAGYAVGAGHGFVLTARSTRSPSPRWRLRDRAERHARRASSAPTFDVTIVEGAGSYVVGEETALLACLQGLRGTVSARPPFPAERGVHGLPTVVNNVETLCNMPFIAAHGADAYRALSPDADHRLQARLLQRALRCGPASTRCRFGMSMRELCEDVAGGLRDGRTIKARPDRRPARRHPPRLTLDTRVRLRRRWPPRAAWSATAASSPSTTAPTCARSRAHLLRFGAHESCGKCFPCRIGLRRAYEMFAARRAGRPRRFEELLEALELGSLCAHGGGMPAPIRSLLAHFPEELGTAA